MIQVKPLVDTPVDVLIVETDTAIADSLVFLLETANVRAISVPSPELALQWIETCHPSCVLIAQELGEDTGIALLTRMRQNKLNTPAIIMAGKSDVRMAVMAMRAGATDFLEKPLTDARLLSVVRDILRSA